MAIATQRVFEIPELLELILLPLSFHSLLSAQLISRCFWLTIRSSPTLQRTLYFRAEPKTASGAWAANQVLVERFRPWFTDPSINKHVSSRYKFVHLSWLGFAHRREPLLRKGASWRHMLPMQPPPTKLTILRSHFSRFSDPQYVLPGEKPRWRAEIEREGGITMGLLYDIVEGFFALLPAHHFEAEFGVRWLLDEAYDGAGRIEVELYCKHRDGFDPEDFPEDFQYRSRADGMRYGDLDWKVCDVEAGTD
ncbi:uncharacterized protein BDZ99DRAFT_26108 [Mytilinidion resinicola]|uniref:F-box domain-containing protein n=1 Tax=Mytilinidion resinicola TaxID=574789 RepID=A0A6A6YKH1_9PEZI|nr:uncharacterized protein BDZ99DRAFT_26108 [Mytilinidion resinicola]KAF2809290.1 hypothetical protein BDZ99DRAFT_26108 [Mytilinidion resinicola]